MLTLPVDHLLSWDLGRIPKPLIYGYILKQLANVKSISGLRIEVHTFWCKSDTKCEIIHSVGKKRKTHWIPQIHYIICS